MGEWQTVGLDRSRCALLIPFVLFALILLPVLQASAQENVATCSPGIGRITAFQGNVEIQRGGQKNWAAVKKLDTALCADDRLRTDAQSRALVSLQPETMVRIDQNTVIRLKQTGDAIEVEFFGPEPNAQARGAGYFITRFPKKFKVTTPHMNAAVEGTEFMVQVTPDATKLTVLEGKVSSQSVATGNTQLLAAGQSIASGTAGPGTIETVIKPQDAVQWVLRYPPISDQSDTSGISRAEKLLRAGSVDEALAAIDAELAANPASSDAHALRAVIQVAKNEKAGALESAKKATTFDAEDCRAWLSLSYAQQAEFDLQAALQSALNAESLCAESSLAHARVAELLLSVGQTKRAEEAARAAVVANAAESNGHTMLGFVHLAEGDIEAARADFAAAIDRDSFGALPRLGLALAKIRDGELAQGREQLEIAVALDPSNSLLRSYVGKAYYEENSPARDELAASQFEFAQQLDANDPTPWFYEAILMDSRSQPSQALEGLSKAAVLNDNRAVYRSRQLLDADLAARSASQASVYNELGLHQVGLQDASDSLFVDPSSSSAHRFMADIYATIPRHETARASELLQSQMRQPLGAAPLQSQLTNDVIFRDAFFGPASVGLNEYGPLFMRDGLNFQLFGLAGTQDSLGDQAILNGLGGRWSFSLGQLAADTDGYRPNNDESIRQYDGFVQWQPSASTSLQFELTHLERESGDLTSAFDPEFFSSTDRYEEELDVQRIGLRQVINPQSDILLSLIRQDRQLSLLLDDPNFPGSIINDEESLKSEVQYLVGLGGFKFIFGASYFDAETRDEVNFPPIISFASEFEPHHFNAYAYALLVDAGHWPQVQIGAAYDDLYSDIGRQSKVSPKIGVNWKVSERFSVRAAGFSVLSRRLNSDQGLEPTQLAGFNQFYDDRTGATSDTGAIGLDFRISPHVAAGIQFERRNLNVPALDATTGEFIFQDQREDSVAGYVYWLSHDVFSFSFEPRYQDFNHGTSFLSMELTELPISVKYIAPSGLWAGVTTTAVKQDGQFDVGGFVEAGSDQLLVVDAIVAYRLPARRGTISLEGKNLLGEDFRFQELDLGVQPRYIPETQVFLRISIGF
jgi:Tfp pilus assembly protein PilF